MWFYTNPWLVLLIKLQAVALVTLFPYIDYITKYITSTLLLIFWFYLLSLVANFWKQTHLEIYVLFCQMHTLNADICLLLLNLKMSITISNWGFIWKYKRYARKSQNDATTNHIILKTLTWGQRPSGLRRCKWIERFLIQSPLSTLPGLGIQHLGEVPGDIQVKTLK